MFRETLVRREYVSSSTHYYFLQMSPPACRAPLRSGRAGLGTGALCAHLSSRLPLALAATEREKGKLFAVGKSLFSRWQAARAGASAACRTPDHLRVLGQILALQRVVLYLSSK